MGIFAILAATAGAATAVTIIKSVRREQCALRSDVMILQANQAFLSKDPQLIRATMTIFEDYDCPNEAAAMRGYLAQNGYSPDVPIVVVNVPMSAPPGHVRLVPGERWRAGAVLGGLGCAVGLGAIRSGVEKKGFSNVKVYDKNPWGKAWDLPDGFLECARFIEATVIGAERNEKKPAQVVKLERV